MIERTGFGPKRRAARGILAAAVVVSWTAHAARAQERQPAPETELWSLKPLREVAVPRVDDLAWSSTEIDRFLRARMQTAGVMPAGLADRRTWLRRLSIDLTGLPPTGGELDAFLGDESPRAHERQIDRLLGSRHYGERQARHWLDIVRYADTAGDAADHPVPGAYRYRNYVIDAFNDDLPYDRFLHEQIAGDILADQQPGERFVERIVATGMIALARRFGVSRSSRPGDPEFHLVVQDAIDTLGRVTMGLTLGCARCHDHKSDPVAQRDYYALYGVFASTRFPHPGAEKAHEPDRLVPLFGRGEEGAWERSRDAARAAVQEQHAEVADLERQAAKLREQITPGPLDEAARERRIRLSAVLTRLRIARDDLDEARRTLDRVAARRPEGQFAYAVTEDEPRNARIHVAGDPEDTGPTIPRGLPAFLDGAPRPITSGRSGRLELARWLTTEASALTARVMVNRIWQHHFGRGLVATPGNFGRRGARPSHPDLLDWLAARFIESGWSLKATHRLILSTRAYRLASNGTATGNDPDNVWLGRFSRRRLDAESLRDAILLVSGGLDPSPGGAHPFPPAAEWEFTQHEPFRATYPTNRRSVYLMTQRTADHPMLGLFDGANPNRSTSTRRSSVQPSQALWFLNSDFVHLASLRLGDRAVRAGRNRAERLPWLYRRVHGRDPTAAEARRADTFLSDYMSELARVWRHDPDIQTKAWAALVRAMFASNEFLYVE